MWKRAPSRSVPTTRKKPHPTHSSKQMVRAGGGVVVGAAVVDVLDEVAGGEVDVVGRGAEELLELLELVTTTAALVERVAGAVVTFHAA